MGNLNVFVDFSSSTERVEVKANLSVTLQQGMNSLLVYIEIHNKTSPPTQSHVKYTAYRNLDWKKK